MNVRTTVFATVRFEGFHRWPDAPPEVKFLRDRHRHVFHVKAEVLVQHNERDVEFILLGRAVKAEIDRIQQHDDPEMWSCETWATELVRRLRLVSCEVSEDGENGAIVVAG